MFFIFVKISQFIRVLIVDRFTEQDSTSLQTETETDEDKDRQKQ